jgi:hypothetical protein
MDKDVNANTLALMKEKCLQFFQNEDIKRNVREIIKPIGTLIYNELFIYIWFICIYNIILFFIIILVLILLLRKQNNINIV